MYLMIVAGKASEVIWSEANWIFLDMGFSGAANARGRTCGLLIGEGEPQLASFSTAGQTIVAKILSLHSTINLVIEAPLSICFRNGNPTGRSVKKMKRETPRLWYVGAGCAVMVASMYLIRQIADANPPVTIRLFEGFVSYKDRSVTSDHKQDTILLREAIKDRDKHSDCIVAADKLKLHDDDVLSSAFRVMGLDCGVPAVIIGRKP